MKKTVNVETIELIKNKIIETLPLEGAVFDSTTGFVA